MPFAQEERMIKTKVIGVASQIDETDKMKVRQVVLKEMFESPEMVEMLYLRQRQVWVLLEGNREFYMGDIKPKYQDIIMQNVTQIVSWEVTGGYTKPGTAFVMAGMPTISRQSHVTNFGLNIHVKLL